LEAALAVALAMAAIAEVGEGISTPILMTEEAVAIAEERRLVGVAFSKREATEGSKPGGGCMSQVELWNSSDICRPRGRR